jgi:hypothetical protein
MPIFRGPNGEIEKETDDQDAGKATRKVARRSDVESSPASNVDATKIVGSVDKTASPASADSSAPAASSDDDPQTRIFQGRKSTGEDAEASGTDAMADPVVGWLVVVAGEGLGNYLPLGYGLNSIGRAASERVQLDYGDDEISRTGHAIVTYEPRGKSFFVQHGGGKNLTYVGDNPVLSPTELNDRDEISLGQTKLKFIAFCGKDFDWQDQ